MKKLTCKTRLKKNIIKKDAFNDDKIHFESYRKVD